MIKMAIKRVRGTHLPLTAANLLNFPNGTVCIWKEAKRNAV